MTTEHTIDQATLEDFRGRFFGDLGATVAAGSVLRGDRLGFYRALAEGPQRPQELAARTHTAPRYVEEWLRGQAAGGYVGHDAETDVYSLTAEQAFAVTDPNGAVLLPGGFPLALGNLDALPRVVGAFRAGYSANLVCDWLTALDGVEQRLRSGITVADVGCGSGASTVIMAQAYLESTFVGSDYRADSIDLARTRAADAGVSDRVRFELAPFVWFSGGPYDLVTTFNSLHELGDPVAAAVHVRDQLADDGIWLVVESHAGNTVSENLERAIRRGVTEAGFTHFRRAAETRLNLIYDVRP